MPAAAIAVTVVGWFVAPAIKQLFDWTYSRLGDTYGWYPKLKEKLEELAEDLDGISKTVAKSSAVFATDTEVIQQLWRLRDAINDAEGLLDEFQHQVILEAKKKKRCPVIGSKKLLQDADKLLKRVKDLHSSISYLKGTPRPIILRQDQGYQPTSDKLFGLVKEQADLESKLRGDGGGVHVIAIVGHAGTGKTKLAQWAFQCGPKFDLRIWAWVYNKFNHDNNDLVTQIWNSVWVYDKFNETDRVWETWKPAPGPAIPANGMAVARFQQEVEDRVRGKRFLLVLDDVCNDEKADDRTNDARNTWNTVLAPFKKHGARGSRILITTRAKICSNTLGARATIVLDGICDDHQVKSLIQHVAFRGADLPRHRNDELLSCNVSKLRGSPLAATKVAAEWKSAADAQDSSKSKGSRSSSSTRSRGGEFCLQGILNKYYLGCVVQAHRSSYQDLPPHLQQCFAFCSIFPKKWRFERKMLIKMWTALGLVRVPPESQAQGDATGTEEGVARSYFEGLVQRSLFEKPKEDAATASNNNKGRDYYVIHDHIHSMIRQVAPGYYLSIDGSHGTTKNPGVPETVRHLSVTTSGLDRLINNSAGSNKLRTLLVFSNTHDANDSSGTSRFFFSGGNVTSILKKFKGVRVLDLSDTRMDEVPSTIGEMKNLRYLGLPKTIDPNKMPRDRIITKLLLLRYLNLSMGCIAQVAGVGSLEMLQGSVEFHVHKQNTGNDKGMGELEKLNSLTEILSIKGLGKVKSKEEAQAARLENKEYLNVLKLEWEDRPNLLRLRDQGQGVAVNDSDVLEGLRPHPNLRSLHITMYQGRRAPSWLISATQLKSLHLTRCNQLLGLPLFCNVDTAPTLFPNLGNVEIIDCRSISCLLGLLYCRNSLSSLRVKNCPTVKTDLASSMFPKLTEEKLLILEKDCPGLKFLPG